MKPLLLRGLLATWLGLVLGVSIALAPAVVADRQPAADPAPTAESRLLTEVVDRIRRDYVDRVDEKLLLDAAVRGMIADLDPHSALLEAAEYLDIRVNTSGKYSGIGVEVGLADGRVVVIAPLEDGPADRAGVLPGDVIFSVDGLAVGGADLEDTIQRLRGLPGSAVLLGLRRTGMDEPFTVELRREEVRLSSVRAELLESGIGYVRLSHFNDATPRDLAFALAQLAVEAGGALHGLALDLRNNPGGVVDAAIGVADLFLDEGLIVSAEGRAPDARFRAEATPGDALGGAPLSVIVNEGSASAAEIVAAALRDHGRARIVGQRTFGKASVQTIMPLSDGRALRLTTARYYTPSGRSISVTGVTPDMVVSPGEAEAADLQLQAALDALRVTRPLARAEVVAAERRLR